LPLYRFRACDDSGVIQTGEESADSEAQIFELISSRQLHPIRVTRVDFGSKTVSIEEVIARYLPIPRQRIADFFDQLATLLDSGISIVDALRGIADQESNFRIHEALKRICRTVESGSPLYSAMEAEPHVFDETCVRVVQAGEHSGKLVQVLIRLSQTMEFDIQVRRKFREATRYPKMVLSALFVTAGLLLAFVVPRFASLFGKAGVQLPFATQMLIDSGSLVKGYWPLMLFFFLFFYVAWRTVTRNRELAHFLDEWRMKIPVLGPLRFKIDMSRSFKILALLIESGVNILQVFDLIAGVTRNRLLSSSFLKIREQLERGESVSKAFQDIPLFPKTARQMLILGERAGRIDESLDKISQMYERDADSAIKRLNSLVEPILIVGIGCLVILFALAIFLPMWDLIKVVK